MRAVRKSPIPPVMTTSGGQRITGASRKKTGGCDRKSLFPSFCFFLFSCARKLTSELDFLMHVWLKFLCQQRRHNVSLILKLASGAMVSMAGTSSEQRENPHISDEEFEQDQSALIKDLVARIEELEDKAGHREGRGGQCQHGRPRQAQIKNIERPDNQAAKFNSWFP